MLLRARLVHGELTDVPGAGLNPAAIVEIASSDRTETHTVFSKYPDFNVVHGRDESESLVGRLRLDAPSLVSKPLVAIILGPDQRLHVQLSTAAGRELAVPVSVGQSVALGDLGLTLELEGFLESARREITVRPSTEGQETGNAFIRLEASLGAKQRISLARRWGPRTGGSWTVALGPDGVRSPDPRAALFHRSSRISS